NKIGINAAGNATLGNTNQGIWMGGGASSNTIGGSSSLAANVIGGSINWAGITIDGAGTDNNVIQGNFIGTDSTGTADFGNTGPGISLQASSLGTVIGGTNAGEGNVIAFNDYSGIYTDNTTVTSTIRRNSLYSNTGIGIDLNGDGVTLNDLNDADGGGNGGKNFFLPTTMTYDGSQFVLSGTYDGIAAARTYHVELFANSSSTDEAHRYLGYISFTTNSSGDATISNQTLVASLNQGEWVSFITTDTTGAISSEIAAAQFSWQEGTSSYTGTQDTFISSTQASTSYGTQTSTHMDLSDATYGVTQTLLRFDNLFGTGTNQIPLGSVILSARLVVNTTNAAASTTISMHRMLANWTEASTYNSMTGGVTYDNVESLSAADASFTAPTVTGLFTISGLEAAVQSWSNGATNYGWVFATNSTDSWQFSSSEDGTVANRPELIIEYAAPTVGVVVTPTTGLATTEAGGTAQFSVVLTAAPTSNVTIAVASSDTTEGTVSTSLLTFTTANWNVAQTVTVTGVADTGVDGNIGYTVTLGTMTSSDTRYSGLDPVDVTLTNNDKFAPVLDTSKTPVLTAENEDAGSPTGAVGTLIVSLVDFASPAGQVDNVTDADAGALLGIAITAADTTNGSWWYTSDGGANWYALGSVSTSSARLLAADGNTRLYFQPNANYNGSLTNAITFRAWDQTEGVNGGTLAIATVTETLLDTFSVSSYSNNNGTQSWTTSWVENDSAGGGAASGNIDNPTPYLRFKPVTVGNYIYRQADLTGATSATFSFNMTFNSLDAVGQVLVQVSNNGGSSFTTLATITNATATGIKSYDISAYVSSNTQIRFYAAAVSSSGIRIDDAEIQYTTVGGGSTSFSTDSDTASLTVNAVNDAPTATITPTTYAVNEQATLTLHGTGLSIADIDAASGSVRATLSVVSGTISVSAGSTGATISGSGTNTVTITGTTTQVNNVLAGASSATVTYTMNSDTPPGSDTLTLTANDQGNTGSGGALTASDTATINITALNDAPTATITPTTYAVNEQATLTLHGTGLSIADVDAASSTVKATLSVVSGTISATAGTTGVTITGSGTNTLTLTGTVTQINNLLAGNLSSTLTYTINSDTPPGSDTLTLTANDQGNTGSGGALTATDTATINITALNDAPIAAITPTTYSVNEQATLTLHGTGLSITDVDAASSSVRATLSVVSGTITATAGTTGVTITGSGTSTVTLTGTLTQINNLLAGNLSSTLTYTINSDTPPASDTLTLTANDQGNTG
ncbi:MAG: hypothetical protein JNM18_07800, partial [Planctomycetaceae bacterium]|nr:hypothetical protein [Planctomycetaceae bacterium]